MDARSARLAMIVALGLMSWSTAGAQDLGDFEDEDFQQFFGLIENGKITEQKLQARCATKESGFTFSARDLVHTGGPQRLEFNATKLEASIDGRPLRSKYHNAAFGEWTGSVFKPICAGLYLISLDVTATGDNGGAETKVHVYLRRAGEERPGHVMTTAYLSGSETGGSGHATIALALHTGDEVSAYSEESDESAQRRIDQATFSAVKIAHVDDLIREFDSVAWDADLAALAATASLATGAD